jgi:DnaJ-class molecular chaperone
MGKGDKPRNCFSRQFKENYDFINWGKTSNKKDYSCPDCFGKGENLKCEYKNPENYWYEKCIRCKGTGRVTKVKRVKCSYCNGNGIATEIDHSGSYKDTCRCCAGNGITNK